MTRAIRWTTRAATQFQEAAAYLDRERSGTGLAFIDQVESVWHGHRKPEGWRKA